MSIHRFAVRHARHSLVTCGFVATAGAADKVTSRRKCSRYQPRQEVQISTPTTEAEISACKVEVAAGEGGTSAWVLRDGRG